MSPIPSFRYELIWRERTLTSVANLTRGDGREFLELAARSTPRVEVTTYPLRAANEALAALRDGKILGAAVLVTEAVDTSVPRAGEVGDSCLSADTRM